ncbi:uncharacterized protein LOC107710894 [Tachysurus ichikawai]
MDSKGPNFTVAETHALLEGVKCHYASIVGSSVAGGMVSNKRKKDIWVEITQNVNAMGSGQKRTLEQVKFRWKNLRARTTKDLAEAKNTQTGNKPFKKGEYTDVILDIFGGENSIALHEIQGVVGDGEPTIVEESEPVPPNAEETFILDLSPIIEIQPGSSLVEPAVTGAQKRGLKRPLPNNNDDAYELLLKQESERAEAQILLAEEQIKLTKLQQTKAKLQIRLLKAEPGNACLSSSDEKEP